MNYTRHFNMLFFLDLIYKILSQMRPEYVIHFLLDCCYFRLVSDHLKSKKKEVIVSVWSEFTTTLQK